MKGLQAYFQVTLHANISMTGTEQRIRNRYLINYMEAMDVLPCFILVVFRAYKVFNVIYSVYLAGNFRMVDIRSNA